VVVKTWLVTWALLLVVSVAGAQPQQSFRGTGVAEVVVDGVAWRFHAFELVSDGEAVSTATWRVGTSEGWLLVSALFVERDVDRTTLDDPAFAILSLVFYVDPSTGLAVAAPAYLPSIEFVPNQAAYRPVFEGLPAQTVVTVNGFGRSGDVLRVSGTVDAVLGVNPALAGATDPGRTLTIRGGFELREVVAEHD
jgi:hypothetical protein